MPTPPTSLVRYEFNLQTESYLFRTPMKFGGRVVNDVTVLNVLCEVTNAAGATATGLGSMTMGVSWAWPDSTVEDATKLEVVLEISKRLAAAWQTEAMAGHPIEICLALAKHREAVGKEVASQYELNKPIPELALLLASAPIEGALFDAHGKAAGKSAYSLLGPEHLPKDLGELTGDPTYRGVTLDSLIAEQPIDTLPLYHSVGALDPLSDEDVDIPVDDGFPETLGQWIERNELTHLKIKLNGDDGEWDFNRVRRINEMANQTVSRGASTGKPYFFSLDFNELCDTEEYVLDLLTKLNQECPEAFQRIEYIEQPTHRDLMRPDAVTMHRVSMLKPVVIDESLTDLASLRLAVSQGYSGIALKACKGHAEALILGAVARHDGLFLCVQDLTCVGASLLHSASLAAHIPGVAAVEGNGRQYCPAGNARWMNDFGPMFEVRGGQVPTALLNRPGLGY